MTTKNKRPFSQDFSGHGKTQQHFKDSCDVNNIVAHYRGTGIDPYADRVKDLKFGYASSKTFSEAMQNVAQINSAFEELPSEIRQSHNNNPATWLDSIADAPAPSHSDDGAAIDPPESSQEAETTQNVPSEDVD